MKLGLIFTLRMSKSDDGVQSQEDPLKGNDQDDNIIIEYIGSDSNSFDEDHVEYTEEIYLDIDSGDHVEEAVEPTDRDKSPELNDLFHCSTCDIDFKSVEKHIQQFHGDHEVLVDDGNVFKIMFFIRIANNLIKFCQGQQEYYVADSEIAIKMEPPNSEDSNDPLVRLHHNKCNQECYKR